MSIFTMLNRNHCRLRYQFMWVAGKGPLRDDFLVANRNNIMPGWSLAPLSSSISDDVHREELGSVLAITLFNTTCSAALFNAL
ncbi:unnamed protein product [Dibothriocephalus latus]|uniref:Uncharacterized protein n=1 Tax=Dibothriocephalus latus TaxID=60516 RepID=A0A3P6PS33_DIBLA|nr:unnamed protein product [Dibothriocephalus latus]